MKLDNRKVRVLFAMFTDLPDGELSDWSSLCDGAAEKIATSIRENVDVSRHMERLCIAAAACAYCDYATLSGGGLSSGEIRVGDVSIKDTTGGTALDAVGIRDHFLAEISDLIKVPSGIAVRSAGEPL